MPYLSSQMHSVGTTTRVHACKIKLRINDRNYQFGKIYTEGLVLCVLIWSKIKYRGWEIDQFANGIKKLRKPTNGKSKY